VTGSTDWQEIAMPNDTQTAPSEEAIRLRSYFIWERDGCPVGDGADHWARAKAELEAELEAELRAASAAGESTAFVMPRLPISTPPRKGISVKIGADTDKQVRYG
jgi:hypothetical protein